MSEGVLCLRSGGHLNEPVVAGSAGALARTSVRTTLDQIARCRSRRGLSPGGAIRLG